ncbi:MAG: outer membrane protein [Gemmataceae bacterium]
MNRSQLARLVLSAVVLLVATTAARAEWQIAGFLGTSATQHSDVRVIQGNSDLTYRGVSWRTEPFGAPPYYGFQLGYFLDAFPSLGIVGDYTHNKMIANLDQPVPVVGGRNGLPVNDVERMDATFTRMQFTDGLNTLTWSLVYRLQALQSIKLQPYVGAGLGLAFPDVETQFVGQPLLKQYEWRGPALHALAGVNYSLFQNAALFAEYKFDYIYLDVDIPGGRQLTHVNSHQFTFGWRLMF